MAVGRQLANWQAVKGAHVNDCEGFPSFLTLSMKFEDGKISCSNTETPNPNQHPSLLHPQPPKKQKLVTEQNKTKKKTEIGFCK